MQLPTIPGELAVIEARAASIIKKIDEMPLKEIGDDLRNTIAQLDQTLRERAPHRRQRRQADRAQFGPGRGALQHPPGGDAARRAALRGLADYLERHPEALIRGKTGKAE